MVLRRVVVVAGAFLVLVTALAFVVLRLQQRPGRLAAPPASTAPPAPGLPVFEPRPAAAMSLDTSALGVSPDGFARWLIRVRFTDSAGNVTRLVRGGDVGFAATHGTAQWQTRLRFDGPAAIVSTSLDGPLGIVVRANAPQALGVRHARTDTRSWSGPRVIARALGPHVVAIGWFPSAREAVTVVRMQSDGTSRRADVVAPSSSYRDSTVVPGATEHYTVRIPGRGQFPLAVSVPPEAAHAELSALAGKAMWLSFSPSPDDPDGYDKLVPEAIVARALRAGVRVIEIRTTYGAFSEIMPAARPTIDALLDAAAARGIVLVAWTVPRATDFEDLASAVAMTTYRTARGNGFGALAVDLERGDDFLGDGAKGYAAIANYARRLRTAVGPNYPLVATVEDPYLGHLTNADYPYAQVARAVDALQPMAYWRMMSALAVTPQAVRGVVRASYAATLRAAGRPIAIDIGGQTAGNGPRGAPPPSEIVAAVRAAAETGAIGVTFFDWNGTSEAQWSALARAPWPSIPL